jgi:hypothetical protein
MESALNLSYQNIKICFIVLLILGLGRSWTAHAQDGACSQPFFANDLVAKMDLADAALAEFDLERFRTTLQDVQDLLPCSIERIHPNFITRFARQMAMGYFLDQDEMSMAQWGTLAASNPDLAWPSTLEDDTHPFRDALAFIEEAWVNGPEGAGVNPPKGGAVLLNGLLLDTPVAAAETPHFVQVCDKRGLIVESFWQDGSGFPHRILKADPAPPEKPPWYVVPDPSLDPNKPVERTDEQQAAFDKLIAEAKAEKAAEEERMAKQYAADEERAKKLAEVERKREAKLQQEKDRRAAKSKDASMNTEESAKLVSLDVQAPEVWVDFVFDSEKKALNELDSLEKTKKISDCSELLKMEPKALLGRLKETEIQCLELRLRHTERMTLRDKISRVLMADAWAKNQPHRWEASIRRHLTEIDRSDADLCYIYARHLAQRGTERVRETIRWSETALINARRQWSGETLIRRTFALHRMKAVAAQQKWFEVEQEFLTNTSDRAILDRATRWRNVTKTLARHWLEYADGSGMPQATAFQVCVSAAGTEDYCKIKG